MIDQLKLLAVRTLLGLIGLIHWRRRKARYFVFMGGPGAGKGTLSIRLSRELGLPHISMGEIFRREVRGDTELGRKIKSALGIKLLPDDLVMDVLKAELSKPEYFKGAILDGVPRTDNQAGILDRMLFWWGNRIEKVFQIEVPERDLVERVTLRRTCSNSVCGRTYHLKFNPPVEDGKCDACGSSLYQRPEDNERDVKTRLAEYRETAGPLCSYYRDRSARAVPGLFVVVDSTNEMTVDAVYSEVKTAVANG